MAYNPIAIYNFAWLHLAKLVAKQTHNQASYIIHGSYIHHYKEPLI